MSLLSTSSAATGYSSGAFNVFALLTQHAAKIWQAYANRKAVQALADLDDRMLKDMGLIASDIQAALDTPLTADPSRHLARVAAGRWRAGTR